MIPLRGLFEAHLTVSDLERSMAFYGDVLRLERAHLAAGRASAFYWIGERGQSMLGLWSGGNGPQRMALHVAFNASVDDVIGAPARLRAAGIVALDFDGRPTDAPVVLAWMPALAVYFTDPDGHLLEFIAMLPDAPDPDAGVVRWDAWRQARGQRPPARD